MKKQQKKYVFKVIMLQLYMNTPRQKHIYSATYKICTCNLFCMLISPLTLLRGSKSQNPTLKFQTQNMEFLHSLTNLFSSHYWLFLVMTVITILFFRYKKTIQNYPPCRKGWLPWIGCAIEFGKSPLWFIEENRKEARTDSGLC